jgi:hypothetical protein
MGKANNNKKKPDKKRGESKQPQLTARGYSIWFPDEEAEKRAIMVLGDVGVTYCAVLALDGNAHYGVTKKHVEALQAEGIPFEFVS